MSKVSFYEALKGYKKCVDLLYKSIENWKSMIRRGILTQIDIGIPENEMDIYCNKISKEINNWSDIVKTVVQNVMTIDIFLNETYEELFQDENFELYSRISNIVNKLFKEIQYTHELMLTITEHPDLCNVLYDDNNEHITVLSKFTNSIIYEFNLSESILKYD